MPRSSWLRQNSIYGLVIMLLVALPFILGLVTNSSPYGVQRGERFIMSGGAVFWMSVALEIFSLAILVMSYNLMFGFTGVISFGHAMFFGLGGYIAGMFLQFTDIDPHLGFFVGIGCVLIVCALLGLVIGLATLRLRGVYFAIFTLALAEMGWIYFSRLPLTGGEDGFALNNLPVWIDPSQNRLNLYYVGLLLFILTFFVIRRLVNSPLGSVLMAVRENEERAQALGYNTVLYKLVAIIVASMMAGLAGILHSILAKKIGPEILGVSYTVDALLMTIIGGVGTFVGPVLGAAGLELLDTVLRDAEVTIGVTTIDIGERWALILGVIFVVVVIVFPYGIVGTWQRWRTSRRKQPNPPSDEREAAVKNQASPL
jgi:branched-chain amino acid transport system permease protein